MGACPPNCPCYPAPDHPARDRGTGDRPAQVGQRRRRRYAGRGYGRTSDAVEIRWEERLGKVSSCRYLWDPLTQDGNLYAIEEAYGAFVGRRSRATADSCGSGRTSLSDQAVPAWLRPDGGFKATDLDDLPQLPLHTELIDGSLILTGPQTQRHMTLVSRLHAGLDQSAPEGLAAVREMSIVLGDRQRPMPDVSLIYARFLDDEATWFPADAVLLAAEVVSQESEVRDRERKPQLYARAGIRHFWRIEEIAGTPVIYVYELDPATSTYALTGIHRECLNLSIPFTIDLDLRSAQTHVR
jgi:Uma2 family endonuclease